MGYFWLPCPVCGREFGGHEQSDVFGADVWNCMVCPRCAPGVAAAKTVLAVNTFLTDRKQPIPPVMFPFGSRLIEKMRETLTKDTRPAPHEEAAPDQP